MSNKNEKKNRLNILRVKIKDFIVPFLNVQSIMCTLTRFNMQRSKKLNICTSKLYLRLTNCFYQIWEISVFFCLNSAALKPTFHFVW